MMIPSVVKASPVTIFANVNGQYTPINPSHAEFIDWLRTQDLDPRVVDFLANRDSCAGATPAQWSRFARISKTSEFLALPGEKRRLISLAIIGEQALDAYEQWRLENKEAVIENLLELTLDSVDAQ